MSERKNISSGTPWEARYGYSRAVRVGSSVFVAGTTAADEHGRVIGIDDPYRQTEYILAKIERALQEAGLTRQDVVRTRMYLVDMAMIDEVGRAHGAFFAGIRPASTAVAIRGLIDPDMLVEIEVTALKG